MKIRSDLLLWIESYRRLVERVGRWLFGWADLWVFSVSTAEIHSITLLIVILASVFRASYREAPEHPWLVNAFGEHLLGAHVGPIRQAVLLVRSSMWSLLVALILPDPIGWAGLICVTVLIGLLARSAFADEDAIHPDRWPPFWFFSIRSLLVRAALMTLVVVAELTRPLRILYGLLRGFEATDLLRDLRLVPRGLVVVGFWTVLMHTIVIAASLIVLDFWIQQP